MFYQLKRADKKAASILKSETLPINNAELRIWTHLCLQCDGGTNFINNHQRRIRVNASKAAVSLTPVFGSCGWYVFCFTTWISNQLCHGQRQLLIRDKNKQSHSNLFSIYYLAHLLSEFKNKCYLLYWKKKTGRYLKSRMYQNTQIHIVFCHIIINHFWFITLFLWSFRAEIVTEKRLVAVFSKGKVNNKMPSCWFILFQISKTHIKSQHIFQGAAFMFNNIQFNCLSAAVISVFSLWSSIHFNL